MNDKEVANASSWSANAGDDALTSQLTVMFNVNSLVRNIAIVEKLARVGRATPGYSVSQISAEAVTMLKNLRTVTGASEKIFKHEPNMNAFNPCADLGHFGLLDGKIENLSELAASLMQGSLLLQREFSLLWDTHAVELVRLLESYQPLWQHCKDKLLKDDVTCRILLQNVEGHQRTGPLAGEAKKMTKLLKQFSGSDVDPDVTPVMFNAVILPFHWLALARYPGLAIALAKTICY